MNSYAQFEVYTELQCKPNATVHSISAWEKHGIKIFLECSCPIPAHLSALINCRMSFCAVAGAPIPLLTPNVEIAKKEGHRERNSNTRPQVWRRTAFPMNHHQPAFILSCRLLLFVDWRPAPTKIIFEFPSIHKYCIYLECVAICRTHFSGKLRTKRNEKGTHKRVFYLVQFPNYI